MNSRSAMEQTRYWMLSTRSKFINTGPPPLPPPPHPPLFINSPLISSSSSSYLDSWEEQAFADDTACVWPPRSYSCTFCKREFRSAQALGGHMNVHRRDRARLKQQQQQQSPPSSSSSPTDHHHENYEPNPNPNPNSGIIIGSPLFLEPIIGRRSSGLELKLGFENWKVRDQGRKIEEVDGDDEVMMMMSSKRRRTSIIKPSLHDRLKVTETQVVKLCPSHVEEELDLELRLGDQPKKRSSRSM